MNRYDSKTIYKEINYGFLESYHLREIYQGPKLVIYSRTTFFNLLANVLVKISGIEIDDILYLKYFF